MPGKHIIKTYAPDYFYHVYNRGVNKQNIFNDEEDCAVFLNLFKKYLSPSTPANDRYGRPFTKLYDRIELVAYCLMPNHFHLLVYNLEEQGLPKLMRCAMTAYSVYFNKKYKRVGTLFQDTYKASLISTDAYLQHISRYIHLNPQDIGRTYSNYPYSSFMHYIDDSSIDWLQKDRILELFNSVLEYKTFVGDYEAARKELQAIKHQLADH